MAFKNPFILSFMILFLGLSSQAQAQGVQIDSVNYAFWNNTPGGMPGQTAPMLLNGLPQGLPVGTGSPMVVFLSTSGSTQYATEKRKVDITATVNGQRVISHTNDTMTHGFLVQETSMRALYVLEFPPGFEFDLANGVELTMNTTLSVQGQSPETNTQTFQLGGWGGN
jgi:hypothetical protein